jgi:hypothetical protein
MKKILLFSILTISITTFNCIEEEETPILCHLYGYLKNNNTQQGVDGIIFQIIEYYNPYNLSVGRVRYDTTKTQDSIPGFFEMDSVCYGTSKHQATGLVSLAIDDSLNPGWDERIYLLYIDGAACTVEVFIFPAD